MIGGAVGAAVTWTIYNGPDFPSVAYRTGSIYSGLFLAILIIVVGLKGPELVQAEMLIQLLGIWIGLIGLAWTLATPKVSQPVISSS